MATKSRNPIHISHDDLTTWSSDLCIWLDDHAADVDLTPRAADFPILSAAYTDAYHAEISPEQFSPLLHTELEALDNLLIGVLRTLQGRIPLLPGVDESALADFGLGTKVVSDWDKLVAVASVCKAHWEDISSVVTPPEYLAVEATMEDMVDKVTEFLTKHAAYRAAIGDKQNAIAYKNTCRDALLECEREIFHWYDAAHPDGKDEWWRTTPWGMTGQASEPEEPEEPEEPTEFYGTVTFVGEGAYDFWCTKPEGVENAKIELQLLPDGLVEFVTDIILVEEGQFVPHRVFDMAVGDFRAYFTPLDADGNPVSDTVTVDFTIGG